MKAQEWLQRSREAEDPNAVHHRDHLLFKSWNHEIFLKSGLTKYSGAALLLASYEVGGGTYTAQSYYKIDDILDRLDSSRESPYLENKMGSSRRERILETISEELNFDKIYSFALGERYPSDQIYINLIPIYICNGKGIFVS